MIAVDIDLRRNEKRKQVVPPHWITIVLGLFSPVLGLIALAISLLSLNTAEKSMKVGQRAYMFGQLTVLPHDAAKAKGTVTVHNSGNTPATKVRIELSTQPGGRIAFYNTHGDIGDIASKDSATMEFFWLFPGLHEHDFPVADVCAHIFYQDVFEDNHEVTACSLPRP